MTTVMPKQKPGTSRQDYETPPEFIEAVKARLGIMEFRVDLAASIENSQGEWFLSEARDSLKQPWNYWVGGGWGWLNPPFSNIAPWAKKCSESGVKIAFLVPAAVGSNWFRDYVDGKARVLLLNGRISFDGIGPYPKDTILCLYGVEPGYEIWNWRQSAPVATTV